MALILCVDDVDDNLKLLEAELEDEGHEVITASCGLEALQRVASDPVAAVVLDWMMPGLSGLETLKRLRETRSAAELPVIMATALSEAEYVVAALDAGANDYVTKPIEIRILLARLAAHLRVRELNHALNLAATTDVLTGLPNRRHFFNLARPLMAAAKRGQTCIATAMLDVDRFKSVNDQLGHEAGDRVLAAVADVMRRGMRETDVVGRLGGEEFGMLLCAVDVPGAQEALDRLRESIAAEPVALGSGHVNVTVSIGFVCDADVSLEEALRRADQALYRAKAGGRNRVEREL